MRKVNQISAAFAVILAFCALGSTAYAADSGFYLELDGGRTNVKDSSSSVDEDATGFRLAAGYQFIPWLSADLAHVDFGDFDGSTPNPLGGSDPFSASADGLELGLVGRIPLGDRFAITAKVGKMWWDSEIQVGAQSQSDSGNSFVYGLGAEVELNKVFALTGTWQRVDISDADVDLLSIGLKFRFGGSASR